MCIVIVTRAHPDYPLILLNNRDEYLDRPTKPAEYWDSPDGHVLGGRDQRRIEQGTWLGVTKQGRIACLTNFREEGDSVIAGRRSRGAIVNAYLKAAPELIRDQSTTDAAEQLIEEGLSGVGGFSLLFGNLKDLKSSPVVADLPGGLAIVSNRSKKAKDVKWLFSTHKPGTDKQTTHALSNSHFGDRTWPKVVSAEGLVEAAVKASKAAELADGVPESTDELAERLFGILSIDTLPRERGGAGWEIYTRQLRNSIFIPAITDDTSQVKIRGDTLASAGPGQRRMSLTHLGGSGGHGASAGSGEKVHVYGTKMQTVILVDHNGLVTFMERTLYGDEGIKVRKGDGDRKHTFQVEDW